MKKIDRYIFFPGVFLITMCINETIFQKSNNWAKNTKRFGRFFFFPNPFFTGGRGKMPFLSAS